MPGKCEALMLIKDPGKKLDIVFYACLLSSGEAEAGGSLGLAIQPAPRVVSKPQATVRDSVSKTNKQTNPTKQKTPEAVRETLVTRARSLCIEGIHRWRWLPGAPPIP